MSTKKLSIEFPLREFYSIEDVSIGDSVEITLDDNPSTGYLWAVAHKPDAILVDLTTHYFSESSPILVGGGGKLTFTLRITDKIDEPLTLIHYRPWEYPDSIAEAEVWFALRG